MNDILILLLKFWGINAVINILGLFLNSRLKQVNGTKHAKSTIEDYLKFLVWIPLSTILVVIGCVVYLFEWIGYFWNKIKDIEI
jgi:predicted transcriptional regulator